MTEEAPPSRCEGKENAAEHDADAFLERLEAEMRTLFFSHEEIAESPHKVTEGSQREALVSPLETSNDTQNIVKNDPSEPPLTQVVNSYTMWHEAWNNLIEPLTLNGRVEIVRSLCEATLNMPHLNLGGIPGMARHINYALSAMPSGQEEPFATELPDFAQRGPFRYRPLLSSSSMRLVRFGDKPDKENTITLLLEDVDLDNAPTFNALSYVWGDHRAPLNQQYHRKRAERRLPVLWDGARIEVTHNLYCFLRRISFAKDGPLKRIRDTPIWIDQLCINQEDIAEKNAQVAVMDRIYYQAGEVISWLGEMDGQTDAAIQLLEKLGSWPTSTTGLGSAAARLVRAIPDEDWQALAGLLSRPYFKRAWIVQEVVLARQLLVLCGDRVITWEDLVETSKLLEESSAWAMLSQHVKVFQSDKDKATSRNARLSTRFGGQLAALLEAQRAIRGGDPSAGRLLLLGRQFEAAVAVDKFFAMLGIAKRSVDTQGQRQDLPRADYSRSLKGVAMDFATYYLAEAKNLGLLATVEDPAHRTGHAEEFPSWLPDPSAPLLPLPLDAGALGVDHNVLFHCWGTDPPHDGAHFVIDGECLVLQGRRIDVVGPVAEPFSNIPKSGGWTQIFDFASHISARCDLHLSGLKLGGAFWRTLVASPDPPSGEKSSSAVDLGQEFGDWCVSLLDALQNPDRHLDDDVNKYLLAKMYSLDDLMFDVQAFGKNADDTVNNQPRTSEEAPEFFQLVAEAGQKRSDEHRRAEFVKLTEQLYDSLCQLWRLSPDDVFPSPERIADTLRTLDTTGPQSGETHKRRGEIQDGIDRFEAAAGMKMDSRRLFTTAHHRLGMGPQSLASGDEVWFVHGANVPVILRRVEGRETFRLIGEAFILGIMHGEALQGLGACLSTDVEVCLE